MIIRRFSAADWSGSWACEHEGIIEDTEGSPRRMILRVCGGSWPPSRDPIQIPCLMPVMLCSSNGSLSVTISNMDHRYSTPGRFLAQHSRITHLPSPPSNPAPTLVQGGDFQTFHRRLPFPLRSGSVCLCYLERLLWQAQARLPRDYMPRRRLTPNTAYGCKPLPWYTFARAEAAARTQSSFTVSAARGSRSSHVQRSQCRTPHQRQSSPVRLCHGLSRLCHAVPGLAFLLTGENCLTVGAAGVEILRRASRRDRQRAPLRRRAQ